VILAGFDLIEFLRRATIESGNAKQECFKGGFV
jgi:hypothetical protein